MTHHTSSSGYVMLVAVLLSGAIATAVISAVLVLGLGSSRSVFAVQQSHQANALAHTCMEEALQRIRTLTTFTGTNNLTLGAGTCTYTVTNTGGATRNITASGTVGSIIRKTHVTITAISPLILVSLWEELP